MAKDEHKSVSRSTSTSDRSKRGARVEDMLNLLSQNYSDVNSPKSRKYSSGSASSIRSTIPQPKEDQPRRNTTQRFKSFMERKALRKNIPTTQSPLPQIPIIPPQQPLIPRRDSQMFLPNSPSFLSRMMVQDQKELQLQPMEDVQLVRDSKLTLHNFTIFRSPHCDHNHKSCLRQLISGTINTAFKASAIPILLSAFAKFMFRYSSELKSMFNFQKDLPIRTGLFASLLYFFSRLSTCVLRGLTNKSSPFFPILGLGKTQLFLAASSWGILIFKEKTRKQLIILALTLSIDLLFKRFFSINQKQQESVSLFERVKTRMKSWKTWLQILIFALLITGVSSFSTYAGVLAHKDMGLFGKILKYFSGWR